MWSQVPEDLGRKSAKRGSDVVDVALQHGAVREE
jgi:hypothetical protein